MASQVRRARGVAAAACAACLALAVPALAQDQPPPQPEPPPAPPQVFVPEAEFGSATQPDGRFIEPLGVATDDAGRVYVADAGAGRIEVYDDASSGHRFLRSIGEGVLVRPVGLVVDNRGRLHVTDEGRDQGLLFEPFVDGSALRRGFGGTGTALGKIDGPRHVDVDEAGVVYIVERDNVRVQWWRATSSRAAEPIAAFGVASPPLFTRPEGIARDSAGRLFVSDYDEDDGEVRVYDPRGAALSATITAPGSGFGQVSSPAGLALDPLERLLVVDQGNDRLQLFSQLRAGVSAPLTGTGSTGAGLGELNDPADAAFAPGALLYVSDAGNRRIVRYRFDDADRDGALDPRDNCPGLENASQANADRDRLGDDCDPDDDGDRILDGDDRCPNTRRGADFNRDGCGDPTSRIGFPGNRRRFVLARSPREITGSSDADVVGVEKVEVALAKLRRSQCSWLQANNTFTGFGSCASPVWIPARGNDTWTADIRLQGPSVYRVMSRATQAETGLVESRFSRQNSHTFRVVRR